MIASLYFLCFALCVIGYLVSFRALNLRLWSFSTLLFGFAAILAFAPGYLVAMGLPIQDRAPWLYVGFKEDVFFIFILYMFLVTTGLILGRWLSRDLDIRIEARSAPALRMNLLLLLVLIYAFFYFSWLPVIPLRLAIEGQSQEAIAMARLQVTHNAGLTGHVPALFGYWRTILQTILLFIFVYYFDRFSQGRPFAKLALILLAGFLAFCMVFATEKGVILYGFLGLILYLGLKGRISSGSMLTFSSLSVVALGIGYMAFMKAELHTVPEAILKRVALQTASFYEQVDAVDKELMWFDNIHMNYLNEETVSPNSLSYKKIFPGMAQKGYVGSAGGLSLGKLFLSFSWWSLPIFFFMVVIYGYFDGVLLGGIFSAYNSATSKSLLTCFYAAMSAFYAPALLSNVFMIFEIPTIFPRNLYPIGFCALYLFRFERFRIGIGAKGVSSRNVIKFRSLCET